MLKRLTFTAETRAIFEQLWDAVVLGSQAGAPTGKPRAQIRREATLQRKLIAVSVVSRDIDRSLRPLNARELADGVSVVHITVEECTLALDFAEKVAWGGAQVIPVANLFDFLEAAPTVAAELEAAA